MERRPTPPINVIQQAMVVRAFMQSNPDATPFSAAPKLKLNRKRISRLLKIAEAIPDQYIEKIKNCNDPVTLRQLNVRRLLRISSLDNTEKQQTLATLF